MSGSAEGAGPGAGGRRAQQRLRRRSIWAGLVIGVVAVSGALAAVLYGGDGDGADEEDGAPRPSAESLEPVEVTHEFPASYVGQVWITITAADDTPHTVTIRWGPWERRLVHESDQPVSYWFTKDAPSSEAENVPATIRIDPGADIAFDQGTPPTGAVDASTDWDPAADGPDAADAADAES